MAILDKIIYGFFYTARDYRISSAQFHHGSMLLLTVMVRRWQKKKKVDTCLCYKLGGGGAYGGQRGYN